MNPWLRQQLACPRDQTDLETEGSRLVCIQGHSYPIVQGIPVMLVEGISQTIDVAYRSLYAANETPDDPWCIDTVGCSMEEKDAIRKLILTRRPSFVDPVVQFVLAATNGILYRPLLGRLQEYPIPE